MLTLSRLIQSGPALLLPILLAIAPASTSASAAQAKTPVLAGIAHAAIRVSDLSRSRIFYGKLGFAEAFAINKGRTPAEAFIKINDRQFIELYPRLQPSEQIGFMHVCFEAADLVALHADYVARGLSPTPVKRAGAGNLLFTMEGPEHQNIEYTEYMPGSMHSKDRGKNLGANRISEKIVALGIEMQDPRAAERFYKDRLAFRAVSNPLQPGTVALDLPGSSGEQLEILPRESGATFRLLFAVSNLGRASSRLRAIHLPFQEQGNTLLLQDPDGNRIVLVESK